MPTKNKEPYDRRPGEEIPVSANLDSSAPEPEPYSVNLVHVVEETTNRQLESVVLAVGSVADVQPY